MQALPFDGHVGVIGADIMTSAGPGGHQNSRSAVVYLDNVPISSPIGRRPIGTQRAINHHINDKIV